jgi:hypothetical protein
VVAGCGKHNAGDGHSIEKAEGKEENHGHEEEAPSGASFKPGKGVILTDETRQSIGVETAEVTERKLPLEIRFNAQVFGENHKPTADETEHPNAPPKRRTSRANTSGVVARDNQSADPKSGEALGGIVLRVNNRHHRRHGSNRWRH